MITIFLSCIAIYKYIYFYLYYIFGFRVHYFYIFEFTLKLFVIFYFTEACICPDFIFRLLYVWLDYCNKIFRTRKSVESWVLNYLGGFKNGWIIFFFNSLYLSSINSSLIFMNFVLNGILWRELFKFVL